MVTIEKLGILLSPSEKDFENSGVINPGSYQEGNTIHLLYRAIQYGKINTIGYAKLDGPNKIVERRDHPLLNSNIGCDSCGLKDPKIVKIEDTFYITYSAYNGMNTVGALATSKDLIHFERHGIISPQINYKDYEGLLLHCGKKLNPKYHHFYRLFREIGMNDDEHRMIRDKDITLFPKKINGKFVMLHSLYPGIQIVYFNDFADLTKTFWQEYLKNLIEFIVLDPKHTFEVDHIGVGCSPIETEKGWLLIYHGVEETPTGKVYHTLAALLQIDKPELEIARLPYPLFSPTKIWEKEGGSSANYVFPSGYSVFDNNLYIYYGAAKRQIAVAKVNLNELLEELLIQP